MRVKMFVQDAARRFLFWLGWVVSWLDDFVTSRLPPPNADWVLNNIWAELGRRGYEMERHEDTQRIVLSGDSPDYPHIFVNISHERGTNEIKVYAHFKDESDYKLIANDETTSRDLINAGCFTLRGNPAETARVVAIRVLEVGMRLAVLRRAEGR